MSKLTNILLILLLGVIAYAIITPNAKAQEAEIIIEQFEYEGCLPMVEFTSRMAEFHPRMLLDGPIVGGRSFVLVFDDYSVGLFVYLEQANAVCAIDSGWVIPEVPAVPA